MLSVIKLNVVEASNNIIPIDKVTLANCVYTTPLNKYVNSLLISLLN